MIRTTLAGTQQAGEWAALDDDDIGLAAKGRREEDLYY